MDHLSHNRRAWNRASTGGCVWSQPVDAATIARARAGDWQVVLTPRLPVPRDWFGELQGKDVLCLASGGGQQVPILAAAGANVVSFDLSDAQLAKDREVAEREGLAVQCVQGDMADLGALRDGSFDLVFHPASNAFVPDVRPVWRECHRVLRAGGALLAGFMNPLIFLFDDDDDDGGEPGDLVVKYTLPYADVDQLTAAQLQDKLQREDMLVHGHTLDTQIGGQLEAGFAITGFYEDRWFDDSWRLARHTPVAMATRARRS